jgi:HlyD family secretion protein
MGLRKTIPALLLLVTISSLSACSQQEHAGAYIGYIEAEYVYVAAPQAGWLVSAPLYEGDAAAIGDVLFELDTDQQRAIVDQAAARAEQAAAQAEDIGTGARPVEIAALEAQLEEARARFAQAKSERDRWMPLVKEGNATRARGDQVVADYKAAAARMKAAKEAIDVAKLAGRDAARKAADAAALAADASRAEAQWRLDQRAVKAKVDGRVEQVFYRQGEFVPAGAPVLSILPAHALKVRFFVPQADLPLFDIGRDVKIIPDGRPEGVTAKVSFIAGVAEFTPPVIYSIGSRQKLVFLVEAKLADGEELRPGLPVDVLLP